MLVGIPKEIKRKENRVAMVPAGVEQLTAHGHAVLVETGAGEASGYADQDYLRAGATIVRSPQEVYQNSEMVVKVKEPLPAEYPLMRNGQISFTYVSGGENNAGCGVGGTGAAGFGRDVFMREGLPSLICL